MHALCFSSVDEINVFVAPNDIGSHNQEEFALLFGCPIEAKQSSHDRDIGHIGNASGFIRSGLGNEATEDDRLPRPRAHGGLSGCDEDLRCSHGGPGRANEDGDARAIRPQFRFLRVDFHDDQPIWAGARRDAEKNSHVLELGLTGDAALKVLSDSSHVRNSGAHLNVGRLIVERLHLRSADDLESSRRL